MYTVLRSQGVLDKLLQHLAEECPNNKQACNVLQYLSRTLNDFKVRIYRKQENRKQEKNIILGPLIIETIPPKSPSPLSQFVQPSVNIIFYYFLNTVEKG
jgi:hypothetical protein